MATATVGLGLFSHNEEINGEINLLEIGKITLDRYLKKPKDAQYIFQILNEFLQICPVRTVSHDSHHIIRRNGMQLFLQLFKG